MSIHGVMQVTKTLCVMQLCGLLYLSICSIIYIVKQYHNKSISRSISVYACVYLKIKALDVDSDLTNLGATMAKLPIKQYMRQLLILGCIIIWIKKCHDQW